MDTLGQQLAVVRRWIPLILLGAILSAIPVYLLASAQAKTYRASARLIVSPGPDPEMNDLLVAERLAADYALLGGTRRFAKEVSAELGGSITEDDVLAQVQVAVDPGSSVLGVQATDADPDTAADIANASAEALIALVDAPVDRVRAREVDQYLRSISTEMTRTQARLDELLAVQSPSPEQQAQVTEVIDRIRGLQDSYATLLPYSSESITNRLEVLDLATVPGSPVNPRPIVLALAAAAAGLVAALALAFVLEYLDDSVKTPLAVRRASGLATIGAIVERARDVRRGGSRRLAPTKGSRPGQAEAYRDLRSAVELAAGRRPHRLLVTSVDDARASAVVASNLAVSYALLGRTVALVDMNLRKPYVHALFEVENTGGISAAYAMPLTDPREFMLPTDIGGMFVMVAGPCPPSPPDLLGSAQMEHLVQQLSSDYDVVVAVAGPVLEGSDAILVSGLVEAAILVVSTRQTRGKNLRLATQLLAPTGVDLLGAVLHSVRWRSPARSSPLPAVTAGATTPELAERPDG